MKRSLLIVAVAAVMLLGAVASAHAAAVTQNYSIVLPRFGANAYSSTKTVAASKDLGVFHKYSGGYPVSFTACNTAKGAIGSKVTIYPTGSDAPLTDLWYNSSSGSKSVIVRVESAKYNLVTVLAEGTWRWNY
ncbi:MAG TPA: hypothetical protein VFG89_10275 [Coriobacteriia bacterium]|nr:hypothetical protein [Coriobacteriia bacterium]